MKRVVPEALTFICLVVIGAILVSHTIPILETQRQGRLEAYEGYVRRAYYFDRFRFVFLTDRDGVRVQEYTFPAGHYEWKDSRLIARDGRSVEGAWFSPSEVFPWRAARRRWFEPGRWHSDDVKFDVLGFSYSEASNHGAAAPEGTFQMMMRSPNERGVPKTVYLDRRLSYESAVSKLTIPLWPLVMLAVGYPTMRIVRAVRMGKRLQSGRCPRCGYDLRATPGRCPECGWEAKGYPHRGSMRSGTAPPAVPKSS